VHKFTLLPKTLQMKVGSSAVLIESLKEPKVVPRFLLMLVTCSCGNSLE